MQGLPAESNPIPESWGNSFLQKMKARGIIALLANLLFFYTRPRNQESPVSSAGMLKGYWAGRPSDLNSSPLNMPRAGIEKKVTKI
jgi:hypothetical protein